MLRFDRNSRAYEGQVLILIAIGSVVLLAFAALAVDTGLAMSERRGAQNAADAASLAVARAMVDGESNQGTLRAMAQNYAQLNGYDIANLTNDVRFPDENTVEVAIHHEVRRVFLGVFYDGDWSVRADATASIEDVPADYGLIALDDDDNAILAEGGSTSGVHVLDGGVMSNGGINCTGSAQIVAGTAVHAAGDILDTSQASVACKIEGQNGGESSGRSPIEDPLAGTPEPPAPVYPSSLPSGSCTYEDQSWNSRAVCQPGRYTSWSWGSGWGIRLMPGTYLFDTNVTTNPYGTGQIDMVPGGEYTFYVRNSTFAVNNTSWDMSSNNVNMYFLNSTFTFTGGTDEVVLGQGLYYFDNSHFKPASGATGRGENVAFFFRNGGSMVASGHTTDMQFTAPSFPLYPGMQPNLLVHAPPENTNFEVHLGAYTHGTSLNGIVYLPSGRFRLTGNTGGVLARGQLIVGQFITAGSGGGSIQYEQLIDMGTPQIWLIQ